MSPESSTESERRNIYTCQACQGQIVTIDRAPGVTPFALSCRATTSCLGRMISSFYLLPPDIPEPTWEWYRPSPAAIRRMDRRGQTALAGHVLRGGLLLRKIG